MHRKPGRLGAHSECNRPRIDTFPAVGARTGGVPNWIPISHGRFTEQAVPISAHCSRCASSQSTESSASPREGSSPLSEREYSWRRRPKAALAAIIARWLRSARSMLRRNEVEANNEITVYDPSPEPTCLLASTGSTTSSIYSAPRHLELVSMNGRLEDPLLFSSEY